MWTLGRINQRCFAQVTYTMSRYRHLHSRVFKLTVLLMCAAVYICNSDTLLKITAEILLAIEGNTFLTKFSSLRVHYWFLFHFPKFFFHNPLQMRLYISSLYIKFL